MIGHPLNDRIVFRYEDNTIETFGILPSDNSSEEFMAHPRSTQMSENGVYFQGDMILSLDQEEIFKANITGEDENVEEEDDETAFRTGVINKNRQWPKDDHGNVRIPYKIDLGSNFCKFIFIILITLNAKKKSSFF